MAAREGARRAIVQGDLAEVTDVVHNFDSEFNVTMKYNPPLASDTAIPPTGTLVTVTVSRQVDLITPIKAFFNDQSFTTVSAKCTMTF
ncbi:Hypothetical protein LUCI_3713 [Lucifera butyrica]|uniref:Uncharacterized protein n=2 Tax=Lucifera butyrica TaxID=1351585 RepID=A0A498RAJ7_9FIRM|nr:Hypothetical protein LUCI_3713 [Lucifera butyrica]